MTAITQAPSRGSVTAAEGATMARGWIHTVHDKDKGIWRNEVEGGSAIRNTFRTKDEAAQAGRKRAQRDKTEHVIHKRDGTISLRNSYGRDDPRKRG